MPWISYSQNFEDVMLMRALKGVERGFYIDIGAQGPSDMSVTKAFYDLGWSGINVEASKHYFDLLAAARARDININCFVGAGQEPRRFFEVEGTGLSTGVESVVKSYADRAVIASSVRQMTLNQICNENDVETVHFLKIDVEGAEKEVIESFSFDRVRPWILVIEATIPNSVVKNHDEWEPYILARDYKLVWDDGLNRFYLAREKSDLEQHFSAPPNFFDEFIGSELAETRKREQKLHKHIANMQRHIDGSQQRIARAIQEREDATRLIESIYASTSWRMTGPVRRLSRLLGRGRSLVMRHRKHSKSISKDELFHSMPEHARWLMNKFVDLPK